MTEYEAIYSLRSRLDNARQPRHIRSLSHLESRLNSLGIPEPYLGSRSVAWLPIRSDPVYIQPCAGYPVNFSAITSDYVYRVCGVSKVVKFSTPGLLTPMDIDEENWAVIKRSYDRKPGWLPLSVFVSGSLTGPRGFTWWTPTDLTKDTVCSAHHIGLPNDYLAANAVLLRCSKSHLEENSITLRKSTTRVPSALDAFDSLIFLSTVDADSPALGSSISVESTPLAKGGDEMVCEAIPVEDISCIPAFVHMLPSLAHRVLSAELLPHLIDFYTGVLDNKSEGKR